MGYYEEAGIDISIVQPPENGATQCCASGKAQFAIDAQDTIAAVFDREEPLGVTAVGAILQHNTSGIMSRAGEGMDSPKGLEGKTYATWDSPIELAMMEYAIKNDGGDFSKVTLIPNAITNEPLALREKQTDAVWVFYGWSGINAQLEGVECDYWYFKDMDNDGVLSPYEDWRNDAETRAADMVKHLPLNQQAGLVLNTLWNTPLSLTREGAKDEQGNIVPAKVFKRYDPTVPPAKGILPGLDMRVDDGQVLEQKLTAGVYRGEMRAEAGVAALYHNLGTQYVE